MSVILTSTDNKAHFTDKRLLKMGGELNTKKMNQILDLLNNGVRKFGVLKEKTKLNDKTLSRYLKYLSALKLIVKKDEEWWPVDLLRDHNSFKTKSDFDIYMEHSKTLIEKMQPGIIMPDGLGSYTSRLRQLINKEKPPTSCLYKIINKENPPDSEVQAGHEKDRESMKVTKVVVRGTDSWETSNIECSAFIEHLKTGYPELYAIAEKIAHLQFQRRQNEEDKIEEMRARKDVGFVFPKEIEELLKWGEKFYCEFARIYYQVYHGSPLKGKCSLCPQVAFKV